MRNRLLGLVLAARAGSDYNFSRASCHNGLVMALSSSVKTTRPGAVADAAIRRGDGDCTNSLFSYLIKSQIHLPKAGRIPCRATTSVPAPRKLKEQSQRCRESQGGRIGGHSLGRPGAGDCRKDGGGKSLQAVRWSAGRRLVWGQWEVWMVARRVLNAQDRSGETRKRYLAEEFSCCDWTRGARSQGDQPAMVYVPRPWQKGFSILTSLSDSTPSRVAGTSRPSWNITLVWSSVPRTLYCLPTFSAPDKLLLVLVS